MLDTQSCQYSWQWDGWHCSEIRSFFAHYKYEASSTWTLIPCVSKFCLDEWQDIWDCCDGNKLHSIYPTVGIVKHSKNISRYDSVLLNRLQIGHSRLTHSYLFSGDDSPTCQSCGIPLTVKQILVECANLRDICEKYFAVSSLADLFNRADNHTVIGFIKETHFYHQL